MPVTTKRLYLTEDRRRVVGHDDPDAAFLLAAEGTELDQKTVDYYGISDVQDGTTLPEGLMRNSVGQPVVIAGSVNDPAIQMSLPHPLAGGLTAGARPPMGDESVSREDAVMQFPGETRTQRVVPTAGSELSTGPAGQLNPNPVEASKVQSEILKDQEKNQDAEGRPKELVTSRAVPASTGTGDERAANEKVEEEKPAPAATPRATRQSR